MTPRTPDLGGLVVALVALLVLFVFALAAFRAAITAL